MYKKFVFMDPAGEIIKELNFSLCMSNYIHVFNVSRKAILYQKQRATSC